MSKTSSRRGFTLPEVLVTVTIVAVLAAVMVPAVINQVGKGDIPAVGQDIGGIRTAITTFAADTRRFPQRLSQLGKASLVTSDTDITATPFDAAAIAAFHGPYAALTVGHVAPTGAVFSDSLKILGGHSICMQDSTNSANHSGTSLISPSQMVQLEAALDPGTSSKTTGNVQWSEVTNTGVTTVVAGSVRVCLTTF